jgi:hypothetical protein
VPSRRSVTITPALPRADARRQGRQWPAFEEFCDRLALPGSQQNAGPSTRLGTQSPDLGNLPVHAQLVYRIT